MEGMLLVNHTKFATIFTPQGDGNLQEYTWGWEPHEEPFATIFTPQGDGNKCRLGIIIEISKLFATIFTPQGDGN